MTVHEIRGAQSYKNSVIIIDDQSTGRVILEKIVRSIDPDLQTKTFADPLAAIEWAKIHPADLILTDYKMAPLDGVETIKRFRQIFSCIDVPIVVVTVIEDVDVRYRALEAGATDFLTKPVDKHECQARCRNLLALRRQQIIIKDRARLLEQQVSEAVREVRLREVETLFRLARAGEYRGLDRGNHVIRIAKYSRLIAEGMGLPDDECDMIELAAPMHDIGKIGVSDRILLKSGALNAEESRIMKTHPAIGHEILRDSPSKYLRMGAVIALGHHEKFDGTGYPNGVRGEDIPIAPRIVAVADVFDSVTAARPYRPAWSIEDGIRHLTEQKGLHFDPCCVDVFLAGFDRALAIHNRFLDAPLAKSV